MSEPLAELYAAAQSFCLHVPGLAAFAEMPSDPEPAALAPQPVPALGQLAEELPTGNASPEGTRLTKAVIAAKDAIQWQLTYDEALVGADFLRRYGWFELLGPTGHFRSEELVAFIGYWGPGLRYPWHKHASREIYAVVDGRAVMERMQAGARDLGPGGTSPHASWEPHALRTDRAPLLALALQAGEGLNEIPLLLPELEAL
ncbi:MAG: dimethylsulfonioproprionate lyase family protein [Pseudomonadota bacterium]